MDTDAQLELFEVSRTLASVRSRMVGMGSLQIRYDHAVLWSMVLLIGVAVVFGMGVERGKLIARAERVWGGSQLSTVPAPQEPPALTGRRPGGPPTPALPRTLAPATPPPAPKAPTKMAAAKSKYAIQVVAYSKLKLARQELKQLLGRGEQAFLIERSDGRLMLCIGPFPSREHASVKLSRVKQRYQGCFIRTL